MNKKQSDEKSLLSFITFDLPSIMFGLISLFIFMINIFAIVQNNYCFSIITIVLILIVFFISCFLSKKIKKIPLIYKIIFIILLLLFILYIGFKTRVNLSWDYGTLINISYKIVKGQNDWNKIYIIRYPNNTILLLFEIFLAKIGTIYNSEITLVGIQSITIIFNSIIVFFNIILLQHISQKILKQNNTIIPLILMIIYVPYYLYATILYSDTIGMFLNIVALLLYYYVNNVNSPKTKKILHFLLVLDIIIGFKFKATNIFIAIAIIIDLISKKEFKNIFKFIILLLIVLIPINFAINKCFKVTSEEQEKYQFPYTHWIMMALNPTARGGYIEDDVQYTASFMTSAEKKEANKKEIYSRIKQYGFKGLVKKILITKNIRTWTEPTISTNDYLNRMPYKKTFINKVVTKDGKYYKTYEKYIRSVYLILIFTTIISIFYNIKERNIYIYKSINDYWYFSV